MLGLPSENHLSQVMVTLPTEFNKLELFKYSRNLDSSNVTERRRNLIYSKMANCLRCDKVDRGFVDCILLANWKNANEETRLNESREKLPIIFYEFKEYNKIERMAIGRLFRRVW